MRVCTKCGTPKEDNEFRIDASRPSGLHCWCNSCTSTYMTKRLQKRINEGLCKQCGKPAKPPRWLCDEHFQKARDNKRKLMAYRKENKRCRDCGEPQKEGSQYCTKHHKQDRNRDLLYSHGITVEEFENKSSAQHHRCAISGLVLSDGYGDKLRIDHDHRHNRYHKRKLQTSCPLCQRGLLLHEINLALGLAEKFVAAMSPAFQNYLNYWNPIVEARCAAASEPIIDEVTEQVYAVSNT